MLGAFIMKEVEEETPYYMQIKDKIIEDINNGTLKHGDKLPSERELAEFFKISRMTARHAISVLEKEGFVERKERVGTFVTNQRIRYNFISVNSFTKGMLDKGLTPTTKTIDMKRDRANDFMAKTLEISSGEEIFYLKRLRIVDGIPVAIELSILPYKYCLGIENHMGDNISLYHVLKDLYDIKLVKQKQRMRISFSDQRESQLLNIKGESPCLLIEGTTHDPSGRIIEYTKGLSRGDLVEFYSEPTNYS
jgi:GntR family transcriptional regulator